MKSQIVSERQLLYESMIRMAGIGAAMENAAPEIKKIANFITKTNNENGVAYAIRHFCK